MLCLVAQLCLTLCNPVDCSLPGSSVHGASPGKNTGVGLPGPPPGDFPDTEIEPGSPASQVDSLLAELPGEPLLHLHGEETETFLFWNFQHSRCVDLSDFTALVPEPVSSVFPVNC